MTANEMLDYIFNNVDPHLMNFEYDDVNENIGYIINQEGEGFKITVSKV